MNEKYNKYFKDKKIIIIGPSSSLLCNKNGDFFDSFDIVCRIKKSYPIPENLTKYLGTKTNMLVTHLKSTNRVVDENGKKKSYYQNNFELKKPKVFNQLDYIYFPYPLIKQFLGFYDNFKINFPDIKTDIIIPEDNKRYYGIKENLNDYDPKIGLMFIYDILKYDFKELYVTGLTFESDGFINDYKSKEDFKNCNIRTNNIHNSNLEFEFFKKLLIKDNRIKIDKTLKDILNGKNIKNSIKETIINKFKISLFYNTTNTINDSSVKNRALIYTYNTLKKESSNTFLEKHNNNTDSDMSIMVSYFKKDGNKPQDIIRKEIFNKNKKTNWIFYDANPLAKFNNCSNESHEYLRISFLSPYHDRCKYLEGNKKRWLNITNKYNLKVKAWRKEGKFILFILNSCNKCGYSAEDTDIFYWVNQKIKKIRKSGCKRPIKIRFKCVAHQDIRNCTKSFIKFSHYDKLYRIIDPLNNLIIENTNVKDGANSLIKDLEQSWAVVLYSTTACLISLIYGVPVFSTPKSISYDLIKADVDEIETLKLPNRDKFFHNFSGQIWSLEEMKSGIFSKKLVNYFYDKLVNNF